MNTLHSMIQEQREKFGDGVFFLTIIFVGILFKKSRLYRTFHRLLNPLVFFFLIYRALTSTNEHSLIFEMVQALEGTLKSKISVKFLGDYAGVFLLWSLVSAILHAFSFNYHGVKKIFFDTGFDLMKLLPIVRAQLQKEADKMEESLEKSLKPKGRALGPSIQSLPNTGMSEDEILSLMTTAVKEEDQIWERGQLSGAIYHGDRKHQDLLNKAFSLYSLGNPLHPDIWPSGMKFECEIIQMAASLVGGGKGTGVVGCTTSGGTESIILSVKAHRDYHREKWGMEQYSGERAEVVACVSAHAAVDKACDIMGLKLVKVPMDPKTFEISLPHLRAALSPRTIMIYSSAPTYPQGVIDPIPEISRIALEYGVGLHVDCCLGGFYLPFAKKIGGTNIPDFDFTLPGVTAMSMDTHKYGYALKGTSVLLYKNKEIRQAQYFCYADWVGGMYTTPTVAGSRSLGMIAQTWASLMHLGTEGYLKHTREIMRTVKAIKEGVGAIKGVKTLGGSNAMIVCIGSADLGEDKGSVVGLNIYHVVDGMSKKGWSLNSHQHPPCAHICVTVAQVGNEGKFLSDLRLVVDEILTRNEKNAREGKKEEEGGNAAIYGMTSALPPGPVNELLKTYNDVVLKL